MNEKICGIVPAFEPDSNLTDVLHETIRMHFLYRIIVVDDGSGREYGRLFREISRFPQVDILHLKENRGTGGATKAGLCYAMEHYPECIGFVTFDADGQHSPSDIRKVVDQFRESPGKFVLGVRDFHSHTSRIPLRCLLGNCVTEIVFRLFTGFRLSDTQTGLRCYPPFLAKEVVRISHNRYEFMLEALLMSVHLAECVQTPISTIYDKGSKQSHFKPVFDSLRIYAVFFRLAFKMLKNFFLHRDSNFGKSCILSADFSILPPGMGKSPK